MCWEPSQLTSVYLVSAACNTFRPQAQYGAPKMPKTCSLLELRSEAMTGRRKKSGWTLQIWAGLFTSV